MRVLMVTVADGMVATGIACADDTSLTEPLEGVQCNAPK